MPLKINRNRRTSERSARLKPAILTGNRREPSRRRWPTAKQAIIIHLQDVCHSQHSLRPQTVLWCLTWITGNCSTWKQLSCCFILTHLHFPSSLIHFSLISFPLCFALSLSLMCSCFLPSILPFVYSFSFLSSPSFFHVSFLLCLYTIHLFYFLVFPYAVFLSFLMSFPFPPFSLLSTFPTLLPFSSATFFFFHVLLLSLPFLTFRPFFSSALLILILQRSNFIGRAFKNQYQGIKLVLLLFCYFNSFLCLCVFEISAHTENAAVRLRVCMCAFARVLPLLVHYYQLPGSVDTLLNEFIKLCLSHCVLFPHAHALHQHMQIPSALMSLHVYIRHDEWINCGNSRSNLVECVFIWFPNNNSSSHVGSLLVGCVAPFWEF